MSSISEDDAYAEVVWKIKNFQYNWHTPGESLSSGDLVMKGASWCIYLYPKGTFLSTDQHISLKLTSRYSQCSVATKIEFSFLDAGNKPIVSKHTERVFPEKADNIDIKFPLSQKHIFDNKHIYLPKDHLTLRIRMTWEGIMYSQCASVYTTIYILQKSVVWQIPNFESGVSNSCMVTFPICDHISTQPIELTLLYENREDIEWLQLLFEKGDFNERLYLRSQIVLSETKELYVLNEKCGLFNGQKWHVKPLISQEKVVKTLKRCSSEVALQINCEFIIVSMYPKTEVVCGDTFLKLKRPLEDSSVFSTPMDHLNFLSTDLKHMYKNGIFSDLQLQVETKNYKVHASILAARSPVFMSMLESDMQEKRSRTIIINDLDEETCSKMLDYFYSADPGALDVPISYSLYYAGDKYQVPGLKDLSTNFLKRSLSTENVFDILLFSDRHQDESLKNFVIDYICRQKHCLTEDKWHSFMAQNVQLAANITFKMFCSKQ